MKEILVEAAKLVENGGDWDRRNKLKVFEAFLSIQTRDLKKVCYVCVTFLKAIVRLFTGSFTTARGHCHLFQYGFVFVFFLHVLRCGDECVASAENGAEEEGKCSP